MCVFIRKNRFVRACTMKWAVSNIYIYLSIRSQPLEIRTSVCRWHYFDFASGESTFFLFTLHLFLFWNIMCVSNDFEFQFHHFCSILNWTSCWIKNRRYVEKADEDFNATFIKRRSGRRNKGILRRMIEVGLIQTNYENQLNSIIYGYYQYYF